MDEISTVQVDRLWSPSESPSYSQQDAPRRQQQDRRPFTPAIEQEDGEESHGLDKHAHPGCSEWNVSDLTSALEASIGEAMEALSKAAAERFLECVAEQQRLCQVWRKRMDDAPRPQGGPDARTLSGLRTLSQAAQLYHAAVERAEAANRALSGALGIPYGSRTGEF